MLTVSQVAQRCGLSRGALLYYESIGLLKPATRTAGNYRNYGDADLRGWIDEYQPDVVHAGHVHESPFKSDGSWNDRIGNTWVFNAGHQIGKVPAFMELDLTLQQAKWVSIMGTESVDLHDAVAPARTVF